MWLFAGNEDECGLAPQRFEGDARDSRGGDGCRTGGPAETRVGTRAQRGTTMDSPYRVGEDVHVLPTHLDVPGVGTLTVNAFVLMAEQPVLVDTGIGLDSDEFIDALGSIVDPADLRWIWLTHDDTDHTGSLERLMELAPQAQLATHALAGLRLSTWSSVPLERVHALSPGERLDLGDRTVRAEVPPLYDNPTSTGLVDESTGAFFCVDVFGAILPHATQDLNDVAEPDLTGGMVAWATFDSSWVHLVDRVKFDAALDKVRRLGPEIVLSCHAPAAVGRIDQFLKVAEGLPDADPFVPPDAAAFDAIVAQMGAAQA